MNELKRMCVSVCVCANENRFCLFFFVGDKLEEEHFSSCVVFFSYGNCISKKRVNYYKR